MAASITWHIAQIETNCIIKELYLKGCYLQSAYDGGSYGLPTV